MSLTISTAIGDVTAEELLDGYGKGINQGGPYIRRKFLVPWAQGNAFANAAMGISTLPTGPTGFITRAMPLACPESPNIFALEVGEIEGTGAVVLNDGTPTWEKAIVPVTFGPFPGGTSGGGGGPDPNNYQTPDNQSYPFAAFEMAAATEVVNVPDTSYKFAGDDLPTYLEDKVVGYPVAIRVPTTKIVATVFDVPYLPWARLSDLVGSVNNATFLGKPRGTILFDNCRTRQQHSSDGTMTQDLTMEFIYRKVGHNKFPDPKAGSAFYLITDSGAVNGNPPYAFVDLRPTFLGLSLS